jgi:hypothetical protein
MQKENISRTEAIERIKNTYEMRKKYIFQYFNMNRNDPLNYHMVVNTSNIGLDEASMIIIEAVRRFSTNREYIPGVKDRRKCGVRRQWERRKLERRQMNICSPHDIYAAIKCGRSVRKYTETNRRKMEHRQYLRRKEDQQEFFKKQNNS